MKEIETSKGRWQVVETNSMQEGQYYVDTIGSFHYKLSEITEEEACSIIEETIMYQRLKSHTYKYRSYINGFLGFDTSIQSLHSLLESQGIEITNNTYIFKV